MTARPQISVIINNYNYGRFLGHAIDSALAQREVRAEVIVVDDGSIDDSAQVIARYGDRIIPHFQANAGQAAALNAGVLLATAPLLAFLDADDWWQPGKLASVVAAFGRASQAGIVYHRLQPTHSDGSLAFAPIPRSLCAGDLAPRLLRSGGRWPFPMTSSLSLRRRIWDQAGAIPSGFRISADAWITGVLPFLAPVVALPQVLGAYRIHDNAWYRRDPDAAMLARRVAHWEETVRVTNAFLASRGRRERLDVKDHFDRAVALARLGRAEAGGPLALVWQGIGDAAEPNVLRRWRDTLRAVLSLRGAGRTDLPGLT
jgi:glycosyltransferase involved in cell wall biosynthesis